MNAELSTKQDRLWVYMILPIILLFVGGMLTYGIYYALGATQPEIIAGVPLG